MRYILFSSVCIFFVSSCKAIKTTPADNPEAVGKIEQGVASWYGPNFHGKKTANGETYDMNKLTAAHRTLPFNSLVKVVNLNNGLSVTVRVNDRGPYVDNRIIDLSKKAAEKLQMIQSGTTNVELILINPDKEISKNLTVPHYAVQVGSFASKAAALNKKKSIPNSRLEEVGSNEKIIYRLYIGLFTDPMKAKKLQHSLEIKGVDGFVKQIEN